MTDNNLKQLEAQVQTLTALNSQLSANGYNTEDEIDLRELWNAIREGKWLIIAISAVFAIGSVLYALSLPDEYKSTVILSPTSSSKSSAISSLAGQLGGLVSLAGINLNSGSSESKIVIAMEILKTWDFLEKFVIANQIEVEVFAVEGWNEKNNQLIIDSDIYDDQNNKWVILNDDKRDVLTAKPNSWELYNAFNDRVSIVQDKITGLITLSVEYYSPLLAKKWTELLVKSINRHFKMEDRQEAIHSISYLNMQIRKTNITEMKSVFYQLIEEQTKTLMLSEVNDEYLFKTISPAKEPIEKSKPERIIYIIVTTLIGVIFSIVFTLILYFKRNKILV